MARFRFIVCDWTNQIWNRGRGLVKGSVNTSFCVQLVFAPNRKSTFSVSDGAMNYYCCQMIPFTSRLELELLILFIYWNIKSLICQLSGPSFIILAAACPTGLDGFPSNDFWSNCPRLFPFLRLSFAFRFQLFSIGSCPSASQRLCFYLPTSLFSVTLTQLSWLRSWLLSTDSLHATILLYGHCFTLPPKMGVTLILISFGEAIWFYNVWWIWLVIQAGLCFYAYIN